MFHAKKYQCFKCDHRQFDFKPCLKCGSDIFLLVCEEFEYGPGDSAGFKSSGPEIDKTGKTDNSLRKNSKKDLP